MKYVGISDMPSLLVILVIYIILIPFRLPFRNNAAVNFLSVIVMFNYSITVHVAK